MTSTLDIAWLGGLLEGEGSFGIRNGSPRIQLSMTDRDILEHAGTLMGVSVEGGCYRREGYKPVWRVTANGTRAISWMMTLYQFLGERRQAKVKDVIETWKQSKAMPRASRGTRFMAICHPDKTRTGNGLCKMCYMREYRKRTGKNGTYYRHREALT